MTNSLQCMAIQNGDALVRQLNGVAGQIAKAAAPPPERRPKAEGLAEATIRLQKAGKYYDWKREELRKAEEKMDKLKGSSNPGRGHRE